MISVAVDFDGTLVQNEFPKIGEPKQQVIDLVLKLQKAGAKLILWTCRAGKVLEEAVEWCADQGIYFDAINENLPEVQKEWGGDTRKVMADYYLDDKNIGLSMLKALRMLVQYINDYEK